jgi:hypothetical protein
MSEEFTKVMYEILKDMREEAKKRIEFAKANHYHIFPFPTYKDRKKVKCLLCGMTFEEVEKTTKPIKVKDFNGKEITVFPNCRGMRKKK